MEREERGEEREGTPPRLPDLDGSRALASAAAAAVAVASTRQFGPESPGGATEELREARSGLRRTH